MLLHSAITSRDAAEGELQIRGVARASVSSMSSTPSDTSAAHPAVICFDDDAA